MIWRSLGLPRKADVRAPSPNAGEHQFCAWMHGSVVSKAIAMVFLAAGVLTAVSLPTLSAAGSDDRLPTKRYSKLADAVLKAGAPAVMVHVRRGKQVWQVARGVADVDGQAPAAAELSWRIASVTKLVAAHLAVTLEREKIIRLGMQLKRFWPEFPKRLADVRLSQLLDHTSRIPEYLDQSVFGPSAATMAASIKSSAAPEDLLTKSLFGRWDIDEMSEHQYSNTNYVLLQHALELASGQSFEALVRARIIEPLRLKSTGLVGADGTIPVPHLQGYIRDDGPGGPFSKRGKLLDVTTHPFFTGADGGLYSSLPDLAAILDHIWFAQQRNGVLLGQLTGHLRADHDGFYRYGYGVMAVQLGCGEVVYGHEGFDLGSLTIAFANRQNTRQLILAVNLSMDQNGQLDSAIRAFREDVFCRQ